MVTIDVTQADLDEGEPRNCQACPIARAADRAFGVPCAVDRRRMFVGDDQHRVNLPSVAMTFIYEFDLGRPVAPFSFDVEDPR